MVWGWQSSSLRKAARTHTHTHKYAHTLATLAEKQWALRTKSALVSPLVINNNCFLIRAMPLANYLSTEMQQQNMLLLEMESNAIPLTKIKNTCTHTEFLENN